MPSSCKLAIQPAYLPGVSVSYDVCRDDAAVLDACPWRDQSLPRLVNTHVKDHMISDATSPDQFGTFRKFDPVLPAGESLASNESVIYNFTITGASPRQPLIVTMVYTDAPGSLQNGTVLVNDLDLVMRVTPLLSDIATGGAKAEDLDAIHYGNDVPGGDRYNTVEQVRLTRSGPAEVTVTIRAHRVVVGEDLRYAPPYRAVPRCSGAGDCQEPTDEDQPNATDAPSPPPPDEPERGPYDPPPPVIKRAPCQTFAVVFTGNLVQEPSRPLLYTTSPSPLPPGICGREPAAAVEDAAGLSLLELMAIIISASLCVCITCGMVALACYRRRNLKLLEAMRPSAPSDSAYLPKIELEGGLGGGASSKGYVIGDLAYVPSTRLIDGEEEEESDGGGVMQKQVISYVCVSARAHTHAHTHACMHARTHAHTKTQAHTNSRKTADRRRLCGKLNTARAISPRKTCARQVWAETSTSCQMRQSSIRRCWASSPAARSRQTRSGMRPSSIRESLMRKSKRKKAATFGSTWRGRRPSLSTITKTATTPRTRAA